jgi:hypothetical protein
LVCCAARAFGGIRLVVIDNIIKYLTIFRRYHAVIYVPIVVMKGEHLAHNDDATITPRWHWG